MVADVKFQRVTGLPLNPIANTLYFVKPSNAATGRLFVTGNDAIPIPFTFGGGPIEVFAEDVNTNTGESVQSALDQIDDDIDTLSENIIAGQSGMFIVPAISDRDIFYSDPDNRGRVVYVNNNNGSATDPLNGVYEYVGGGARLAQGFYQGLASVVQPLVDEAADSADAAAASAASLANEKKTLSIAITSGITLTDDQASYGNLILTGSPSVNIAIAVPNNWRGRVTNAFTTTVTLTIRTSAGTGINLPRGGTLRLVTDGTNVVNADSLVTSAKRVVIGRVIARSYDASNNLVISTTGGRVYDEALGAAAYSIASASNVVLGTNQALVADLTSTPVSGQIVPSVVTLPSVSATGWQTGTNIIVLFANAQASATVKQYGGRYTLDCPDPDADALTNSKRARRVVDGRVIRLDYTPANSVTISTTEGRVWDESTGTTPSARVAAVTDVVLAANQGLVVDLGGTPVGGYLTPTVVTFTSSAQAGWQYGNKIVLFSMASVAVATTDLNESRMIFGGGAYTLDVKHDPDQLIGILTPGVFKVLQKGANPTSSRYTRWALVKKTDAATRCNIWHNEGLWDSALVGRTENKIQELWRTSGAEMETAILVGTNTAEFVGGYAHRYQEMKQVGGIDDMRLFVDGVAVDINASSGYFKGKVIEAFMSSTLYLFGTSTPLADVYTHWRWARGELVLTNHFAWRANVTITRAFTGILSTHRTATTGDQGGSGTGPTISITDTGMRDPLYAVEDLSTDTYTDIVDVAVSSILRSWGSAGYHFEVEKTKGWTEPTRYSYFSHLVYNKAYQSFLNRAVAAGESHTIQSRIRAFNPN